MSSWPQLRNTAIPARPAGHEKARDSPTSRAFRQTLRPPAATPITERRTVTFTSPRALAAKASLALSSAVEPVAAIAGSASPALSRGCTRGDTLALYARVAKLSARRRAWHSSTTIRGGDGNCNQGFQEGQGYLFSDAGVRISVVTLPNMTRDIAYTLYH